MRIPLFWAQRAPDEQLIPLLALRRWFWSQTLAAPTSTPGGQALWAWGLGLLALLVLAMIAQGPARAIGQAIDLPGHLGLVGAALERLKVSSRLVMIALGAAVISWTSSLLVRFRRPSALEDLLALTRSRSVTELAVEQGVLAALTPLRDVMSLGDTLVLLAAATAVVFKFSADRWGDDSGTGKAVPTWSTLCWAAGALYGLYRLTAMFAPTGDLPMGGCLVLEALVVPALMAASDGLLAAWVLVELRRSARSGDVEPIDVGGAI